MVDCRGQQTDFAIDRGIGNQRITPAACRNPVRRAFVPDKERPPDLAIRAHEIFRKFPAINMRRMISGTCTESPRVI